MPGADPHAADSPRFAEAIAALATSAGWQQHYPELERAGRAAVPDLLKGAVAADEGVRLWCVDLLGKSGDARADDALFAALADPVADVRRHAVLAVAALGKRTSPPRPDAGRALAEKVERDRSLLVRRLAAHVLADLPADTDVAAVLRRVMLREKDAKLRNAVWRAIGRHESMTEPFT